MEKKQEESGRKKRRNKKGRIEEKMEWLRGRGK